MVGAREGGGLNGGKHRMKGRLANGSTRDKMTMAEMKATMSMYWKDGLTYQEIADRVSEQYGLEGDQVIKPGNVTHHIRVMLRKWEEMGMLNIDQKMALIMAKLDMCEAIAIEALFQSFDNKETKYHEVQLDRARSKEREKWLLENIQTERARIDKENFENMGGRGKKLKTHEMHDISGAEDSLVTLSKKIKKWTRKEKGAGDPRWLALVIDITDKRAKLWKLYSKNDEGNLDSEFARMDDQERTQKMAALIASAMQRKTGDVGNLAPILPIQVEERKGPRLAEPSPLLEDATIVIEATTIEAAAQKDEELLSLW